jgi:hypothetical protein
VAQRIVEHDQHHLMQPRRVGQHAPAHLICRQGDAALLGQRLRLPCQVAQERRQIQRFGHQFQPSRIEPREQQQIVDQRGGVIALADNIGQQFVTARRVGRQAALRGFGTGADQRQRGAEFVAGIGDKRLLPRPRLLWLVLLGDQYIGYTLVQVLVPFASAGYKPLAVGAGQVALYVLALVALSFYVKQQLGRQVWRLIHFASFGLFGLALLHGIFSGSDGGAWWAQALYWLSGGSVLFLTVYRVLVLRPGQRRA